MRPRPPSRPPHQTEHTFPLFIGVPALHWYAWANAGTSAIGPFTRHFAGECGFVRAIISSTCGVSLVHQPCAYAMKNSCSS
jgi:hypothetical protein